MPELDFSRVALVIAAAAVVGGLAVALRQPLLVGFLGAGILVGPAGLGWVADGEQFGLLADLGIAVLLFLVGLKLDPRLVRTTGPVALATGLGQVLFTSIVGFVICLGLGFPWLPALYIAVALTFSSTIIIVKLLSDKRELETLHGRIAVGFLIVQDLVVVIALIGISALGRAQGEQQVGAVLWETLLRAALFLGGVLAAMRWLLPRLMGWLAKNRELLLLSSVAWAVALAAAGKVLGFSAEVGAFLAGFALASTPYREAIASRLVSLRDFLLLFFFLRLGADLPLRETGALLGEALVLSVFVLVGNPLIVLLIMGAMGYRARTGFLAGLTVAQISEFSLILIAMGAAVGHVDGAVVGLVTAVGLVTIGLSTYLILYSGPIYRRLAPWLQWAQRRRLVAAEGAEDGGPKGAEVLVVGLGRHGREVAEKLLADGDGVLAVDIDPDALAWGRKRGLDVRYGDAGEPEFAMELPLEHLRWVICTLPGTDEALALLHGLRAAGYRGRIALTARGFGDAQRLEHAGADLVLSPHALAADRVLARMREGS